MSTSLQAGRQAAIRSSNLRIVNAAGRGIAFKKPGQRGNPQRRETPRTEIPDRFRLASARVEAWSNL